MKMLYVRLPLTNPLPAVHVYIPLLSTTADVKLNTPVELSFNKVNWTFSVWLVVLECDMMVTSGGLPNAVQLRVKLELTNFSVHTEVDVSDLSNIMSVGQEECGNEGGIEEGRAGERETGKQVSSRLHDTALYQAVTCSQTLATNIQEGPGSIVRTYIHMYVLTIEPEVG